MTVERMTAYKGADTLDLVEGIDMVVDYITKNLSSYVIIDPHNNDQGLRYNGQDLTYEEFLNLWKGVSDKWGGDPRVIFGLYNEPRYGYALGQHGYFDPDSLDRNGQQIAEWARWMQGSIDLIRKEGADNLILVPGLHWTSTPQWDGGGWWGETLAGVPNAGNSRLASLKDPLNRIAYDVHSYQDERFSGEEVGCAGYLQNEWGGVGADQGLDYAIAWAKKYNKKFMVTEMGSWMDHITDPACEDKMVDYIKRMDESGVFVGRQVWQFGCEGCLADQWSLRPYNWGWYQIKRCSMDGESCGRTACCYDPSKTCYAKNESWAECLDSCTAGKPHDSDASGSQDAWTCTKPSDMCSEDGKDCRETRCCKSRNSKCFVKNDGWAACRPSCTPGVHQSDPVEYQTPWNCTSLARTSPLGV
jgi:hypothetical protein